jgi:hypothetical protein
MTEYAREQALDDPWSFFPASFPSLCSKDKLGHFDKPYETFKLAFL